VTSSRENIDWSGPKGEELKKLRAQNKTYKQCAEHFGCTRSAVSGAWARIDRDYKRESRALCGYSGNSWSEIRLTERWTDYTARKRAERAANRLAIAPRHGLALLHNPL
jgi:hypothetical protein